MKKVNWSKIKEKVINAVRFTIFTVVMIMGFWFIYCMLWNTLGFPVNTIAMWLLFAQALISEFMFLKWLNKE